MRANSKHYPPKYIDLGLTKQVNYNVTSKQDEIGETSYDYDYVIVNTFTYKEIIRALMLERYSLGDELAIINNNYLDSLTYGQEHADYHVYRLECKNIAKALML